MSDSTQPPQPNHDQPTDATLSQVEAGPSAMRQELQRRWARGERVEAERLAPPGSPPEVLLPLVCAELVLREELGERPCLEEYRRRLPELAEQVGRQMALLGLLEGDLAPPVAPQPVRVPGYTIERKLGEGGMGVVFLARQVSFNRPVALKMITSVALASADGRARFRTEAEAIARLNHPNIVQVYEAGEWQPAAGPPAPYFSMEYCPGGTLAAWLAGNPLPDREAARSCLALALGVAAAHQAGVVHRDLKPANVLIAADGTLKISDFGLARIDDDGHTQTGAVMGTPSYMAPEQAEGKKAGPAVDVYALGAILYEMLVGYVPFKGASAVETLDQVRTREPASPSLLRPGVSPDLETICLKCLNKEPERRYPSVQELAEDLQRFLDGRPILARPVGLIERGWRWGWRNPALAGLIGVSVAAVAILLAVGFWFSARLGALRAEADADRQQAEAAERLAASQKFFGLLSRVRARTMSRLAGWREKNLEALALLAQMPDAADNLPDLRAEAAASLASVDLAEAGILWKGTTAHSVAWHRDGHRVALGSRADNVAVSATVALIDVREPAKRKVLVAPSAVVFGKGGWPVPDIVVHLAFSPDGRLLVAGMRSGKVSRWELSDLSASPVSWQAGTSEVTALFFSPDGKMLYTACGKAVRAQDTTTWKVAARADLPGLPNAVRLVPGQDVILAVQDGWHHLSARTLRPVRPTWALNHGVLGTLPDGRIVYNADGVVEVRPRFAAEPYRLVRSDEATTHSGAHLSAAVSPDGRLTVTTSRASRKARLWETSTSRMIAELVIGGGTCKPSFSPDGRFLALLGEDETKLYRVADGAVFQPVCMLQEPTIDVAVHPDGRSFATYAPWGLRGWNVTELALWPLTENVAGRPLARWVSGGFVVDGSTWLGLSADYSAARVAPDARGKYEVARVALGRSNPGIVTSHPDQFNGLAFGPDGRAWATVEDQLLVWSRDWRPLPGWQNVFGELLTGKAALYGLAVGPTRVAVASRDGALRLFRSEQAELSPTEVQVFDEPALTVCLSPDEQLALVGSQRGALALVDVPGAKVLARGGRHDDEVAGVAFLGGGLLASGSMDRTVRLWRRDGDKLREEVRLALRRPVRRLVGLSDGATLLLVRARERGVSRLRVDHLLSRLDELGLGAGLPHLKPAPLPPVPFRPALPAPAGPSRGLRTAVFGRMLGEGLAVTRTDSKIDFDWSKEGPADGVGREWYSVRWDGWLKAPRAGKYLIEVGRTQGARLFLDGRLVIDMWPLEGHSRFAAEVELTGEPQALRVEMNQWNASPRPRLLWSRVGGFKTRVIATDYLFTDEKLARETPVSPMK